MNRPGQLHRGLFAFKENDVATADVEVTTDALADLGLPTVAAAAPVNDTLPDDADTPPPDDDLSADPRVQALIDEAVKQAKREHGSRVADDLSDFLDGKKRRGDLPAYLRRKADSLRESVQRQVQPSQEAAVQREMSVYDELLALEESDPYAFRERRRSDAFARQVWAGYENWKTQLGLPATASSSDIAAAYERAQRGQQRQAPAPDPDEFVDDLRDEDGASLLSEADWQDVTEAAQKGERAATRLFDQKVAAAQAQTKPNRAKDLNNQRTAAQAAARNSPQPLGGRPPAAEQGV